MLNSHITRTANGWSCRVGRFLIGRCNTEQEAKELQAALARPEAYLDDTDDNIDLTESEKVKP